MTDFGVKRSQVKVAGLQKVVGRRCLFLLLQICQLLSCEYDFFREFRTDRRETMTLFTRLLLSHVSTACYEQCIVIAEKIAKNIKRGAA